MKAWQYQRGRYKQLNLKFFKENKEDMKIYHYLKGKQNISRYLKVLICEDMGRWHDYEE